MATIRAYTTIEQSRKLAEIFPLESADMYYPNRIDIKYQGTLPIEYKHGNPLLSQEIAAWSLAALLSIASTYCNRLEITLRTNKKYNVFAVKGDFVFRSFDECSDGYDDLVDACVAMIERLHELNLL